MTEREEFVALARHPDRNMARLCRRFGISRKTGYKWLKRAEAGESMANRSRRPHHSPNRTPPEVVQAVLALRDQHSAWGGRKIERILTNRAEVDPPSPSTITEILRRHGRLDPADSEAARAHQRFEYEHPNDLWQMDFKGHFGLADGSRCHPLTMLDDHSRYSLTVTACSTQNGDTVRSIMTGVFRRYGLPKRILADNGGPWGNSATHHLTPLALWLLRLDVPVIHGRVRHPQTQGKAERFHRTLDDEALKGRSLVDQAEAQGVFDEFRHCYNHVRPHEALDMQAPAKRYQPSPRPYPELLAPLEYPSHWETRKVQRGRFISFKGRTCRLPKCLCGYRVGLEPTLTDGVRRVRFGRHEIGTLDERGDELEFAVRVSARYARSDTDGDDNPQV